LPTHDVLLAGFPCQAFSIAGHRQGFDDEKGRGNLFFNIHDILKEHKPRHFLLENVKNLKGHDNGQTYQKICSLLTDLGYGIKVEVLNAKDYNLLQNRERIFIIGEKSAWRGIKIPSPDNVKMTIAQIDQAIKEQSGFSFEFPGKEKPEKELGKELDLAKSSTHHLGHLNSDYYDPPSELSGYFQSYRERKDWDNFIYNAKAGHFEKARNLISRGQYGEEVNKDGEEINDDNGYQCIYQWRRKYIRRNASGVCPTLTANMGTGGHNVPLIVCGKSSGEKLVRKLTPKECVAFQGFPKDFQSIFDQINIANGQKYKQAGNSVPVPVIRKIAKELFVHMK
jgi:DNA (cytosine-5)-methyltransferase 1